MHYSSVVIQIRNDSTKLTSTGIDVYITLLSIIFGINITAGRTNSSGFKESKSSVSSENSLVYFLELLLIECI